MINIFNAARNADQVLDVFEYKEGQAGWFSQPQSFYRIHLISVVSFKMFDLVGSCYELAGYAGSTVFREVELCERIGFLLVGFFAEQTNLNKKIYRHNVVSLAFLTARMAIPHLRFVVYALGIVELVMKVSWLTNREFELKSIK